MTGSSTSTASSRRSAPPTTPLEGGERIWWDYRDWSATNHVPAVVGSWPAPFVGGYEGRERPVAVECEGGEGACALVRAALEAEGVTVAAGSPPGAIRVLVGPWARLRTDPAAALIEAGPQDSGVFADFERRGARLRARSGSTPAASRATTSAPGPAWSPRPGATKRRRSGW